LSLNRITYLWISQDGKRFIQERTASHFVLKAMVELPSSRAWLIFDSDGKHHFEVAGTDCADRSKIEKLIFDNPAITIQADSLSDLSAKAGIPARATGILSESTRS